MLIDTPQRGYLIDWESYAFGDAATDITSYFRRYGYGPEAMLPHAALLPHFDADDWRRTQLYLVFERAKAYVARSRGGRPWDDESRRENDLAKLYAQLQQDEAWLNDTARARRAPRQQRYFGPGSTVILHADEKMHPVA